MAILNRETEVAEGRLRGVPCGNPAYTVFKGVPYARPPIGEYRWRSAAPPEKWDGVRDCTEFAPISAQQPHDSENTVHPGAAMYNKEFYPCDFPMSEDCLYLNVWTPNLNPSEKLPVMMWIHGGGFSGGYSYEMEFDGEAFCRRDVILVSIGYRVGAMGFFAHPGLTEKCPNKTSGNYGISDAIQALKWLRENISAFGGDPENITIFGQSAGGALVQCLLTSPRSEGLFHRAIVQSAGSLNTLHSDDLESLSALGVEICEKSGKTIEDLRAMPAYEMNQLVNNHLAASGRPRLRMSPNVDGYYLDVDPGEKIAAGNHHNVPIMTGSTSGDGGLFLMARVETKDEFDSFLRNSFGEDWKEISKFLNVKSDGDVSAALAKLRTSGAQMPPRAWAKSEIINGRAPIYIYLFDRQMPGDNSGAFHSAELWYVFGTIDRCWRSMVEEFTLGDYALARAMSSYWANFAKTGDPNGSALPPWPAYSGETPVTMLLDENTVEARDMAADELADSMADSLVRTIYKKIGKN